MPGDDLPAREKTIARPLSGSGFCLITVKAENGVNVLKKPPLALGASVVLALSLWSGGGLLAQQTEPTAKAPMTGSTKPDPGKPAVEKSMPSSAPAATTTQMTGATNQSKKVKTMNDQGKAKVETEGK